MWEGVPPVVIYRPRKSRREFVGCGISDNRPKKEGLNINAAVSAIVSKASKFGKVSHDLWVIPCQRRPL